MRNFKIIATIIIICAIIAFFYGNHMIKPTEKNRISKGYILYYGIFKKIDRSNSYYAIDLTKSNLVYRNAFLSDIEEFKYPRSLYVSDNKVFIISEEKLFVAYLENKKRRVLYEWNNSNITSRIAGYFNNKIVCTQGHDESYSLLLIDINSRESEEIALDKKYYPFENVSDSGVILLESNDGEYFFFNIVTKKIQPVGIVLSDQEDFDLSYNFKVLSILNYDKSKYTIFAKDIDTNYQLKKQANVKEPGKYKMLPDHPEQILIQEGVGNGLIPILPSPYVRLSLLDTDTNKSKILKGFALQGKWIICK